MPTPIGHRIPPRIDRLTVPLPRERASQTVSDALDAGRRHKAARPPGWVRAALLWLIERAGEVSIRSGARAPSLLDHRRSAPPSLLDHRNGGGAFASRPPRLLSFGRVASRRFGGRVASASERIETPRA